MLHSLQYYACCYALLCLLHQQQRAAALTIIIDGATTNEWSTRDEYRRMLEAGNELESSLSQQQQQQQDQQLDYEQQPPPAAPPFPPALRQLSERDSSPQHFCGKQLIYALDLVCQGRYYAPEIEPQIVEPSIKTKRASRSRSITSSSFQSVPESQSPPLSLTSSSSSLSSSSLKPQHKLSISQQPPIVQSIGELDNYSIDGNGGSGANNQQIERNRQQLRMMQLEAEQLLPAHLTSGNNRQQTTDINNNGDTISSHNSYNNNNNPLTNKPRSRYNRMVLNRRARGASDECCKHACSLEALRAYCQLE